MQRSMTGVGPTLRKARLVRGVTIQEASRDTKIRAGFLEALEDEDFDRLLGDVHVRGCLRTYASYLGLSPDAIVGAYAKRSGEPPTTHQAAPPPESTVWTRRSRDNQRLAAMVVLLLLVVAAGFGVLSARHSSPEPAAAPSAVPVGAEPLDPTATILVSLLARQSVEVTVRVDDGRPETFQLEPGEGRSFEATVSLGVRLDQGASTRVTVSGRDLGFPGKPGRPWKETFSYGASPTPTATGTP